MDPQEGPWLLITMDDGTVYLVGDGAEDMAGLYEQLK